MTEKASKAYEKNKNKGSKTVADPQIREPVYDLTKPEAKVKAVGPRDREDSGIMVNDYPSESIVKENISTKNDEAKLRTTSDKEC
ncbi:MAG TPA: hypothetical protein VFZ67_00040 [Nitrososphaera sp.]